MLILLSRSADVAKEEPLSDSAHPKATETSSSTSAEQFAEVCLVLLQRMFLKYCIIHL